VSSFTSPCRLSPIAADESLHGMQIRPSAQWVCVFPKGTTVLPDQRIVVSGTTGSIAWVRTVYVIGPKEPGAHEAMTKVQCEERG
jgi:hypothetical protein